MSKVLPHKGLKRYMSKECVELVRDYSLFTLLLSHDYEGIDG
ncbi:hypothetical protein [Rossellomorea sp. NS-SX7]